MRGSYPRLAIVTGADSGMGQATAELLATSPSRSSRRRGPRDRSLRSSSPSMAAHGHDSGGPGWRQL